MKIIIQERKFFYEKSHQVWFDKKLRSLVSFGIKIDSRYDKGYEIVEMIRFIEEVASLDLGSFIEDIFYDSPAYLCNINIISSLDDYHPIIQDIQNIAEKFISQYDIRAVIGGTATMSLEQV